MVDKSKQFTGLVRTGYFARAILYAMIGFLALTNTGRIAQGTEGIFEAIQEFPAGTLILWVMAVGLLAYALFRAITGIFDIENNGSDAKGLAKRAGHGASAIGHVALAWSAYQLASSGRSSDGGGAQELAAGVLSVTMGGVVLGLLGIAFIATALLQFRTAISGTFMNRIDARAPDATRWLGAAGYSARGVVYAIIGWSLFKAGFLSAGTQQVRTVGDAIIDLADQGIVFTLTALGLMLFGLFSLVLARYQIIPDLDLHGKMPTIRST